MSKQSSFLIYAASCIAALWTLLSCMDTDGAKAEHYLRTNTEIQRSVGSVRSLSRTKTTIVKKGDHTNAYRAYQFIVRGSRGNALVDVQVDNIEHPSKVAYSIRSIDEL